MMIKNAYSVELTAHLTEESFKMKPIDDCEIKRKITASMNHFFLGWGAGMVTRKDNGNEKKEN